MSPYQIEHLLTYRLRLAPPLIIGPVPGDLRIDFPIVGGEITGPHLQGSVKPGGADFGTLRTDGVFLVDVRGALESHDGALIEITYTGVMDLGPDGYEKFLNCEAPATAAVRAAPRFRTAHPAYAWMNRLQCISIGQATPVRTPHPGIRRDLPGTGGGPCKVAVAFQPVMSRPSATRAMLHSCTSLAPS
jgi:hypothetical protein